MRIPLTLLLFATFALTILAWSKEDHELFRVRDELNALQGSDTNFYEFLGVKPSASIEEIGKQNKKRSRQLHPDKAIPGMLAKLSAPKPVVAKDKNKKPGVTVTKGPSKKDRELVAKEANTRYQLFSVVVAILKSEQRERYDHFLRNGFPTWRGSGYYFKRYRPGLGTVMAGLFIVFGGAAHYGAILVGYQRQRRFMEKYVDKARTAAWGSTGGAPAAMLGMAAGSGVDTPPVIPDEHEGANGLGQMPMNRRQKRMQEKEDKKRKDSPAPRIPRSARYRNVAKDTDDTPIAAPEGVKRRVQAENGKTLVVDSIGNVFLEDVNEEGEMREFLLDPDDIPKPSFTQTALCRLPIFLYKQSIGRAVDHFQGISGSEEDAFLGDEGADLTTSAIDLDQNGSLGATSTANGNQEQRHRKARMNGDKSSR